MMRTLVFQSYKSDPAPWIATCLQSVRTWATTHGYTYRMLGDELFDPVPATFRAACGSEILPVTDVGRVLWAGRFHAEGFDRAIWLDADVLVFDPERFVVEVQHGFGLCREIWVDVDNRGAIRAFRKVNNCVLAIEAGCEFSDAYLERAYAIGERGRVRALDVGTNILTAWGREQALPLTTSVATVNYALIRDFALTETRAIETHAEALGAETFAAHFVHAYTRPGVGRFSIAAKNFETAADAITASRGRVLNPRPVRRAY